VRVDLYASQPHYLRHLAPVWNALDDDERGRLVVHQEMQQMARQLCVWSDRPEANVRLAAGWVDVQGAPNNLARVLMEHGVGQTYVDCTRPNYIGGQARKQVNLFLMPTERAASMQDGRCAVIGSPYLDHLRATTASIPRIFDAAVSFHFDAGEVSPEATSGWRYFRAALPPMADRIMGHGHPRAMGELARWYHEHEIMVTYSFEHALFASRSFVCDNSSTIFYAAAMDVPVILLNPPQYRKHVEHGLRFWECAGVGENVDEPAQLEAAVNRAVQHPELYREARAEVTSKLFPFDDGRSAERAVRAMRAMF
jgi:hypothetical protein